VFVPRIEDFWLNAVCVDEAESDSDDEWARDYYGNPKPRLRAAPRLDSAADSRRLRYWARFNFGVAEGVMRIYPLSSTPSSPEWTTVKDNPTFQFRWQGRETGEGQIQLEALESLWSMTFSKDGIKVDGVFDCPYISGGIRFTGTKTSHGRDQTLSSAHEWS
jgi:hypothetical protein